MQSRRVLLVGAGGMGQTWARTLVEFDGTEIAGWIDLDEERVGKAIEEVRAEDVWVGTDLEKAIAEVKPNFLIDVSSPEAHCDVTLTALDAGIPVLGEKPMAVSMDQARLMVAASEKSGKLYMVSQSRRYDARLAAYKQLIEKLSPLGILQASFYIGAHFGGFRDEMPSPLILDMAIHTFDAARYLSGADPVSVYCEEFNPGWSWYAGAASANALFTMSKGIRFTYSGSWCAEGLPTSWESEWRAVGQHGTTVWDGHHSLTAEKVKEVSGFMATTEPLNADIDGNLPSGIKGALVEFIYALETGKTPMGECHDNIKSLAMVFGAIESSNTGKRVPIETGV